MVFQNNDEFIQLLFYVYFSNRAFSMGFGSFEKCTFEGNTLYLCCLASRRFSCFCFRESFSSDCSWSHTSADMLFVLKRKVGFQEVDPCFRGWVESKTSSSVFDISCIV